MAQLYPSFGKGLGPFFSGHWGEYSDFLTFKGGLNPVTGGLWLTDIAHHHLSCLFGLGCLSCSRHQIHIALPINKLFDAGVCPQEIPVPHEFLINRDVRGEIYACDRNRQGTLFNGHRAKYEISLTLKGVLYLVTGVIW